MDINATLALILDPRCKEDKKPLKIRVTFDRIPRYYAVRTKIRLSKEEFKNDRLKVTKVAMEEAADDMQLAQTIIDELGVNFTFDKFSKEYKSSRLGPRVDKTLFLNVAQEYVETKNLSIKTISSYKTAINLFKLFKPNIRLANIDSDFVDAFIQFIKADNKRNETTLRIYLRTYRTIFNYAINKGYVKSENPFSKIDNQPLTSINREAYAMEEEDFNLFLKYKPKTRVEEFAKDFFMLSFSLCGANMCDILRLKNENIDGNMVSFSRHKTASRTSVIISQLLTKYTIGIIRKYGHLSPSKPKDYIFPFLADATDEKNLQGKISYRIKVVDNGLKSICNNLNIPVATFYTARHTYGMFIQDKFEITQIQKFLGHTSPKTTAIYLGKLTTKTKKENKDYLDHLLGDE